MKFIKERLNEFSTWKGVVSLAAGIVMFFTPDHIDRIIEMTMGSIGIMEIVKVDKKKR